MAKFERKRFLEIQKYFLDCRRGLEQTFVNEDAREMLATGEGTILEHIHLLEKLMTWLTSLSLKDECLTK